MTKIRITPLGVNPKTCTVCGEDEWSTKALYASVRRHAACVRAMRQAQHHLLRGRAEDALAVLDACIGSYATLAKLKETEE